VRGLQNTFVTETEKEFTNNDLLSYPSQHQLTKEFRSKSSQSGQYNYASFWSGQGGRLSRVTTVSDLMSDLKDGMKSAALTTIESINSFNTPKA
jgi:NAD(P)H-dependent flavin oxidoreductase YrpB (nitropropane dioxygenase family)